MTRGNLLETLAFGAALFLLATFIALAVLAFPAEASTNGVMSAYVGGNAAWWTEADPYQADAEAVGALSASLSPHISLVGSTAWGLCNSYVRGAGGVRVTATDVNNQSFDVAVGVQYRMASKAIMRPNEWAADVSVGYIPLPEQYPRLSLVAQGWYGLDTHRSGATIGARWRFPL